MIFIFRGQAYFTNNYLKLHTFVAEVQISIFCMVELYSIVYICHIFFIQESADGQQDCSNVLTIELLLTW